MDEILIENVNYLADKEYLISYEKNKEKKTITFSDIQKIWNHISYDKFENGRLYLWNKYIAFSVITASGQGGVLFVWDTEIEEFVHYSNCDYGIDFIKHKDSIFILHDISNFVTPYHFRISKIPFFSKNIDDNGTMLFADKPQKIMDECTEKNFDGYNVTLKVLSNSLYVSFMLNDYLFLKNIDKSITKAAEENREFYEEHKNQLDPNKIIIKGMLL